MSGSRVVVFVSLCILVLSAVGAQAQSPSPIPQQLLKVSLDSGPVRNARNERGVIYSALVQSPDPNAPWIRLAFSHAQLGRTPVGGQPTMLRITSLLDNAVQTMNGVHLKQWQNTSAYFNGDAVLLEIIADPGAPSSRIAIDEIWAGTQIDDGIATICGSTDDRVLSFDPRAARLLPVGCTGWIFNDGAHCFLTAGHCSGSSMQTVQFNVPLSTSGGGLVNPPPEDQYAVDVSSKQSVNGGQGNDWGYFGCFPNSNTGLTPFQAQGDFYIIADAAPPLNGQTIRITGYGVDSSPPQNNQVQQTSTGPYLAPSGANLTILNYQADTTGGNSGSAVLDEGTQLAIGIHTHGGCNASGGSNKGTAIQVAGLQNALDSPQGVCIPMPGLMFNFPDGIPDMLEPAGDSIRVEVVGANGGQPQQGSGVLAYSVNGGALVVGSMSEVSPNVYDAIFPQLPCGAHVTYYFSAQTSKGDTLYSPENAPVGSYGSMAAISTTVSFQDNFQAINSPWTVTNSSGLTAGAFERLTPFNNGPNGPPNDFDGSGRCYLTQNGPGDTDVDGGSTSLTSPAIDASANSSILSYARWYFTANSAGEDSMVVQISTNGGATWITLETLATGATGWVQKHWNLADVPGFTPSTQFRVRFTVTDNSPDSTVEAAVDAFELVAVDCGTSIPCPADIDGNTTVNVDDLLAVINAWGACASCPADINGNGVVNVDDLLAVINAWGPCN